MPLSRGNGRAASAVRPFSVTPRLPFIHRYPYVGNNPILYTDPLGLLGCCGVSVPDLPNPLDDVVDEVVDKGRDVVEAVVDPLVGAGATVVDATQSSASWVKDRAMDLKNWVAGCDWRGVVAGSVLFGAGTGLAAIGIGGGAIMLGAEGAAAPHSGGTSLLLTVHTLGVAGAVTSMGAVATMHGGNTVWEACTGGAYE